MTTNNSGAEVIYLSDLLPPKKKFPTEIYEIIKGNRQGVEILLSFNEIMDLVDSLYNKLRRCFLKRGDGSFYVDELAISMYKNDIFRIFNQIGEYNFIQESLKTNPYMKLMVSEIIFGK